MREVREMRHWWKMDRERSGFGEDEVCTMRVWEVEWAVVKG